MAKKGTRSWLSLMLSMLLTLMSVAPAFAVDAPASQDPDIAMLQSYGIVKGDGSGDLKLDTTITRAELATIAVRAMGAEELSTYFDNSTLYSDMTGRFAWANRYAAMANSLGAMKGRGDGIFDPGSDITNAEVFTVILRLVEREPQGAWDPQRIMSTASQLGIAEGPTDVMANLPAYRGAIFKALAKAMTKIQLADGSTALHKYIDKTPPTLTVDAVPATANATVTVTGTANGATSVTVNGQAATLNGSRFTANVSLTSGSNAVAVVAKDAAGNTATQNITITRSSNAAKIEVTGAASVKPGETITVKATAYDSANRALPADAVTAKLSNSLATYDAATGAFKAGSTVGKVTITFTSGTVTKDVDVVIGGLSAKVKGLKISSTTSSAFTVRKSATVQVQAVDDNDVLVTEDQGRQVLLVVNGLDSVTVTPSNAPTVNGVATFTVTGTSSGDATLTAVSAGLTSDSKDVVFGTGTRVVLIPSRSSASANGAEIVDIRGVLEDENGNTVTNSSTTDIVVDLSTSAREAYISDRYLTIRRGTTSSSGYDDGSITAGRVTETARVSGTISSSHNYTVVPASVSFGTATTGSATRLDIVGGGSTYDPDRNPTVRLTVKAVNSTGALVTDTSYAFQLEVTTSNNEPLTAGVPDGLSVELGNTGRTPVKTATVDQVVARTENGTAEINVAYNKSGDVTVKLVGVSATNDALNDYGVADTGIASRSVALDQRVLHYAGAVADFKLVADLTSLRMTDQPYGVLKTGGTPAKIKAYFVDAHGGRVTNYSDYVTLSAHDGTNTRLTSSQRARASGGVAEFSIASTSSVGEDTYTATARVNATDKSHEIVMVTADIAPQDTPTIGSMRSETGDEERMGLSDSYLQIELGSYSASRYGFVKVFRSGGSLVYTSPVMDLSGSPFVRVPRASLVASDRYYIKVNNGVNDSPKSDTWATAIRLETPLTVDITNVNYDAVTKELTGRGSGIVADSTGGRIEPSRLNLHVSTDTTRTNDLLLSDAGAACTTTSSAFKCTLTSPLLPATYSGTVTLETKAGWYYRSTTGDSAKEDADLTDNIVTPTGNVTSAAVSFGEDTNHHVTGTLTLTGAGLSASKIYFKPISLVGASETVSLSDVATKYISNTNSTTVTITLPSYNDLPSANRTEANSIAYKIKNMQGPIKVQLGEGWLLSSSGNYRNGEIHDIPLYARSPISTVRFRETDKKLIFTGTGFAGGSIDMTQLTIKTRTGALVADLASYPVGGTLTNDTTFEVTITNAADVTALTAHRGDLFLVSAAVSAADSWFMNHGMAAEQLTGRMQPVGWLTY